MFLWGAVKIAFVWVENVQKFKARIDAIEEMARGAAHPFTPISVLWICCESKHNNWSGGQLGGPPTQNGLARFPVTGNLAPLNLNQIKIFFYNLDKKFVKLVFKMAKKISKNRAVSVKFGLK